MKTIKNKVDAKKIIEDAKASGQPIPVIHKLDDFNKKAKAVGYDEKDAKQVISGKLAERVTRQHNCRKALLIVRMEEAKLHYLKTILKDHEANRPNVDYSIVEYNGVKQPIYCWKTEYNYLRHMLKENMRTFEHQKQALRNDGLTNEQVTAVLEEEKYIKYFPDDNVKITIKKK